MYNTSFARSKPGQNAGEVSESVFPIIFVNLSSDMKKVLILYSICGVRFLFSVLSSGIFQVYRVLGEETSHCTAVEASDDELSGP